jgi:hypothetical protein
LCITERRLPGALGAQLAQFGADLRVLMAPSGAGRDMLIDRVVALARVSGGVVDLGPVVVVDQLPVALVDQLASYWNKLEARRGVFGNLRGRASGWAARCDCRGRRVGAGERRSEVDELAPALAAVAEVGNQVGKPASYRRLNVRSRSELAVRARDYPTRAAREPRCRGLYPR